MQIYFNEESAWEPEDDRYNRGIPHEYEELLEKVEEREQIPVEGAQNSLIQNLEDGDTYGLLETRQNPFKEYVLETGVYSRDDQIFHNVKFLELEHIQERAKIVRTGEEEFRRLIEIRSRLMSDDWNARVIDMEDIDLESYTPIH